MCTMSWCVLMADPLVDCRWLWLRICLISCRLKLLQRYLLSYLQTNNKLCSCIWCCSTPCIYFYCLCFVYTQSFNFLYATTAAVISNTIIVMDCFNYYENNFSFNFVPAFISMLTILYHVKLLFRILLVEFFYTFYLITIYILFSCYPATGECKLAHPHSNCSCQIANTVPRR